MASTETLFPVLTKVMVRRWWSLIT